MKRIRWTVKVENSVLQTPQRTKKQNICFYRSAFGKSHLQILMNWGTLPHHVVLHIFQYLWNEVFYIPHLWRKFEFELNQPATSYLKSTHPDLIQHIIKRHADHLQYVNFKVDSSTESAEAACDILSQLVNCSIKTLGLISAVKPSFMNVSKAHFASALTVVFVNSMALLSIKTDDTPYHGLRQLAWNYYKLSDELLLAPSHEKHVNLEHLCIDVVSENPGQIEFHTIKKQSWDALVKHTPKVNIVIYFFLYKEEFDTFFKEKTLVTLIKLVVCANGLLPLNDELICIAECCKNLTAMGLGECEVTCRDFIEFVRMRGARLTLLSIMEEVLIPDNGYNLDQIHSEISKHHGRMWFPDMRLPGKLATENINMVKTGSRHCFLCK
uniref:Uncharacterized protein n=1 Tax=Chelydra serpentina TaxID=8475 RepID=A0A8C3T732_CHESE